MMAQLSHNAPLGRRVPRIIGVSCAGWRARSSACRVWPKTSCSLNSSPAARRKTRTVRLLTLGLITLSLISDISTPPLVVSIRVLGFAIRRQRWPGARRQRLYRIGEVDFGDRVFVPLHPDLVRFHQDLGVGEAVRRLEAIGGE